MEFIRRDAAPAFDHSLVEEVEAQHDCAHKDEDNIGDEVGVEVFFLLWNVPEDCTEGQIVGGWVEEGVISGSFSDASRVEEESLHARQLIKIVKMISNECINVQVDSNLFSL